MRVIFILLKAGQEQIPVQILLNVNRFLLARRGDAFPSSTETLLSFRKHKYNVKTDHRFRHDFGSSSWLLQIWEKDKEFKEGIITCVCVCMSVWVYLFPIVGVSQFTRFHVGLQALSVQVLESYIKASTDHGSISRAGLGFSPRAEDYSEKEGFCPAWNNCSELALS